MHRHTSKGFTLIELLMVVAIVGVIAAIALPSLLRARMSADEASAIGSMRAISSSQFAYSASAARGGFAETLPRLAIPCNSNLQPFMSSDLTTAATVIKSGYEFTMTRSATAVAGPDDCNTSPTVTGYFATAVVSSSNGGSRAFAVNTIGSVWENVAAPGTIPPTEAEMEQAPTPTVRPIK